MGKGCRKGAVSKPGGTGDVGSACSGAGGGSGSASCGTGGGGCGAASRVGGCGGGAGNGCGRGVAAGTVVGRIADGAAGGAAGATAGRLRERRPPVGILECTKTTTRRNRGSWEPRRPRAPTRRWMVAGANSSLVARRRPCVWVREGTCEHKIARNGVYITVLLRADGFRAAGSSMGALAGPRIACPFILH
jgi:hypothetical protein